MHRLYIGIIHLVLVLIVFSTPTFSQVVMDELIFSSPRGFYVNSFTLEISNSTPGTVIKFTKDGSDPFTSPTSQSLPSPAAVNIDPTDTIDRYKAPGVVIRACAVKDGILLTKQITQTYLFLDRVEELSPEGPKPGIGWPDPVPGIRFQQQGIKYGLNAAVLHDLRYQGKIKNSLLFIPTISVVTDLKNLFDPDSGIYVNPLFRESEWEKSASVELLNPDGSPGFQINAGLRIRGGWGRTQNNYKHAFRLFFRKEYGDGKLRYPLFGDEGVTEFDNIDLRTSQNYSWAYDGGGDGHEYTEIREVFSRDTQRDMKQPYTRSRYYHLYINGTYWGVYQTQERSEASFGESYLGGSNSDYDVVKVNVGDNLSTYVIEATDGNLDTYQMLWENAVKGFDSDETYYKVQGLNPDGSRNPNYPVLVDIGNLIDYMLCSIYVADSDGPVTRGGGPNNFYGMKNRNADQGFIFLRHDAETSLLDIQFDVTTPTNTGIQFGQFNPRWLHQKLTSHPEYCLHLYDHVYKHFFNNGVFTPQACRNRFLERKQQLEDAVIVESARWGDTYSAVPRTKDDDWQVAVDWILNTFFPARTEVVLKQLLDRKLYPAFDPPIFNLTSGIIPKGTSLTMNAAEGTVYYTVDGNDTHVSATMQKASQTILVPRNAPKRILVPTTTVNAKWKYDAKFNDSTWQLCNTSPGGIGYDLGSTYDDDISFDVQNQMYTKNSTCMIRIPFQVTADQLKDFNYLTLRVQYNDGIAVYLNKNSSPLVSKNLAGSLTWNSHASAVHSGKFIESIDLTQYLSYLVAGQNLLGIQGLNITPGDSTFFISVELIAGNTMKSSGPVSPSAVAYSGPIPINHTTKVKARVYKDDQWSALNEIFVWVPEGNENLKITEIMYHPLGEGGVDEKEFEFIEFKNIGNTSLDISEFKFTYGINYMFPTGTSIDSSAHLVIASNDIAFESRYHFVPFGKYSGQLSNAGDTLVLLSNTGDTVMNFSYGDDYPWPSSPDGLGYSLIRIPDELYQDLNNPESWHASLMINGNPGKDDRITAVETEKVSQPRQFILRQNYPNPFNPSTTITFSLPSKSFVTIKIYDLIGREIATVVSEELGEGSYVRQWSAQGISSGVYFYRIRAGNFVETKKMILLR
jgi:hypothetical protein